MTRKRGLTDRIEKMTRKRKRLNEEPAHETSTLTTKPNHLNDRLFNLQMQIASRVSKSSSKTQDKESPRIEQPVKISRIQNLDDFKISNKSLKHTERKKKFVVQPKQSALSLKDVGGQDDALMKMMKLFLHLKNPELSFELPDRRKSRIFLHGPPGTGKTHIVRAIAGEVKLPYIEVVATELLCNASGKSESKIQDIFEEAEKCAPCILFIDELDVICPQKESADKDVKSRIVSQLSSCLHDLSQKDVSSKLKVIVATNKPDFVDLKLRYHFKTEIKIRMPNEEARLKILQVLCRNINIKLAPDFDIKWLAHHTPGFVGADLEDLVYEAVDIGRWRMWKKFINNYEASANDMPQDNLLTASEIEDITEPTLNSVAKWFKCQGKIPESEKEKILFEQQDFKAALQECIPYSKREGFGSVPDVIWDDVGALQCVKKKLQKAVLWPLKYRKVYQASGWRSTKGILLFGPKGCGKTLLAKALANESSINFLSVKGPELLSMYLGESEKQVRQIFERAKYSAPCVIFFDEFDSLCPPRTGSNVNQAVDKVVNQLLTLMDGVEELKGVIVIGATNRIDKIDSAMLRPGRLDKVIYVGVPSPGERVEILKAITKNKTEPRISVTVDLEEIALDPRCDNFSGADLSELVNEACEVAAEECVNLNDTSSNPIIPLQKEHFELAFQVVKPSVTEEDNEYFNRCLKKRNML